MCQVARGSGSNILRSKTVDGSCVEIPKGWAVYRDEDGEGYGEHGVLNAKCAVGRG